MFSQKRAHVLYKTCARFYKHERKFKLRLLNFGKVFELLIIILTIKFYYYANHI